MPSVAWRGAFHTAGGLAIALAAHLLPRLVLLTALGALTVLFLAFEVVRLRASKVNSWFFTYFRLLLREEEMSRPTGASYVLIAAVVAFLAFPIELAILAVLFLAVGDPAATFVGRYVGRRRLFGRSVEGDIACLVTCLAIGAGFHYAGSGVPLWIALAGAVTATVAQGIRLGVNDNLSMPLFALLVMWLLQTQTGYML